MYKIYRWFEKFGNFAEKVLDVITIFSVGMLTWSVITTLVHHYCYKVLDAEEWVVVPLILGLLYVGYRIGAYYKRECVMVHEYKRGYAAGLKANVIKTYEFESEENDNEMDR